MSAARKPRNIEEKTVTTENSKPVDQSSEQTAAPVETQKQEYGITNIETLANDKTSDTELDKELSLNPTDPPAPDEDEAKRNAENVEKALARKTEDGKGDEIVPPADFESFATDGVEQTEDEKDLARDHNRKVAEIAKQVLAGQFGAEYELVCRALLDSNHNPGEVYAEVNHRLSSGAVSALLVVDEKTIATQCIRGEWGDNENVIKQRLVGAGHIVKTIENEMRKQLGD